MSLEGGEITAGNLDVETIGDMTWSEASPDRTTKTIDLNAYKIVPGDTIRGSQDVDVALQGNNLRAKLSLKTDAVTAGGLLSQGEGVTLTYTVVDKDGAELIDPTPINDESIALNLNAADGYSATTDGSKDFTVSVEATFDENTPDQVRVRAQAELAALRVSLQQVRGAIDAPDQNLQLNRTFKIVEDNAEPGVVDYGDTINVTYKVANRGFTTAKNVTINDTLLEETNATVTPNSVDIPANKTQTFTANYKPTPEDLSAGALTSTNTVATGDNARSNTVEETVIPATPFNPNLTIEPTTEINPDSDGDNKIGYGDTVTYTWKVRNDGNADIDNVKLVTNKPGLTITPATANAPQGSTATFTATYTPTHEELSQPSLPALHATVTGTTTVGSRPVSYENTSTPVNITTPTNTGTLTTTMSFIKDENTAGVIDHGDTIKYTTTLTNTGNYPVTADTPTDTYLTNSGINFTSEENGTLQPGESRTYTATFTPAAADLNPGSITITPKTILTPTVGAPKQTVSNTVTTPTTPLMSSGELSVEATAPGGTLDSNETVTYTYTFKNTGPVTLLNVTPTSNRTTTYTPANKTSLAPGETATFTGSHNPGNIDTQTTYTATHSVTATPQYCPEGTCTSRTYDTKTSTLTATPTAKATLTTSQTATTINRGNQFTLTHTITNTGNTTINNAYTSTYTPGYGTTTSPTYTLLPGETQTINLTLTPTQSATMTTNLYGTTNANPSNQTFATNTRNITVNYTAAIISSSSSPTTINTGATATHTHTITNTGTNTLTNYTVNTPGGTSSTGYNLYAGQTATLFTTSNPTGSGTITHTLSSNSIAGTISHGNSTSSITVNTTPQCVTYFPTNIGDKCTINITNTNSTNYQSSSTYHDGARHYSLTANTPASWSQQTPGGYYESTSWTATNITAQYSHTTRFRTANLAQPAGVITVTRTK